MLGVTVATSTAAVALRQASAAPPSASMTTPSRAFSRNAREACLQQALAQLPDEQREALRLRYVESLPSKEIAARLGKTDAAVRVMLTRSLKKLQSLLGEDGRPSA